MPSEAPPLPRWARTVDALTVALAGLGLLLELTAGPRFTLLGVQVSLRSGTRLLLLAAVLAGIRHLIVRRTPLHRRMIAAFRRAPRTVFTRSILPVFVTTRLGVLVIGYLAVVTIGFPPGPLPFRLAPDELRNLPARWDTGWYYNIATFGYEYNPADRSQQTIAFFPAYPLLMRYVGRLLGSQPLVAGLLVSFGAFLAALVYLFRLARQHLDEDQAAAALLLLAAYPFAIFYSAVYTESVFLLGTVAAFYHLSRGHSGRAAAWGLLVGLTRPNGFLLSVPLAVVAAQPLLIARTPVRLRWWWLGRSTPGDAERATPPLALAGRLAAAAAPIAGMLVFGAYLYLLTGDPFMWRTAHTAWGRTYQGISGITSGAYRYLIEYGVLASITGVPFDALNALATTFAIALVWPVTRRFGLAYGLVVAINVAAPLVAGGVLSMGRITSVLFPMFLWLGAAVPARQRPIWATAFGMGQAFAATLFFTWRQLL
jgi:hypothetical protein